LGCFLYPKEKKKKKKKKTKTAKYSKYFQISSLVFFIINFWLDKTLAQVQSLKNLTLSLFFNCTSRIHISYHHFKNPFFQNFFEIPKK